MQGLPRNSNFNPFLCKQINLCPRNSENELNFTLSDIFPLIKESRSHYPFLVNEKNRFCSCVRTKVQTSCILQQTATILDVSNEEPLEEAKSIKKIYIIQYTKYIFLRDSFKSICILCLHTLIWCRINSPTGQVAVYMHAWVTLGSFITQYISCKSSSQFHLNMNDVLYHCI